jgi:hypothetical protein
MAPSPPDDVHVESACQGYRILPIRQRFDSIENNTVCLECMQQTPLLLITSVVCEELTYAIAMEEHGANKETHSWEILADRRPAPPGKKC